MKILLIIFSLVTYLTCALSDSGTPISLEMACKKALSAVTCSFNFANNGNEDYYLFKRNTPLEGIRSPFLTITREGTLILYEGIIVYRLPPTKENFVLLKAGESISVTVQITDAFSIDTDGLYTVQYSRPLQYLSVNEMSAMSVNQLRESSVRESVQLYLEDTHLLLKPKKEEVKIDYTVHLQDCGSASFSNGDKNNSLTLDAHKKLCDGIDKALRRIGSNDIYERWFGTYTFTRGSTVRSTYDYMKTGLDTRSLTYYNNGPDCKSNEAAYTTPSYWTTTVYLCGPYYGLGTYCSGTGDTKERILAHEWSHALANRADEEYGVDKCKELARSSPDKAINNADSYSYHYCESQ
ncbi:PREDICTED: uncharacterized protein LOC109584490 [Amphimedon queenslandica]|uniref:Lysine-specific metallo-endopeptidase domain-containing protein n=1 Tax=Amphimedon queenslandica TaxID=400682 RepID=A0A1X7VS94_AMPQE|nr:PREDICTED: uncharacterized protein LOC109584490 [Amphimedon queenslandica]|eukprot:XP_019855813.1 PREDICTED: uncharacterized protein LOC109584490 [Amphimedon queenslandica]